MAVVLASPHLGMLIGCQCWPSIIHCPSHLGPLFVVLICWSSPHSSCLVLIIHPLCRLCSAPSSCSVPSHRPWPCPTGPIIPSFLSLLLPVSTPQAVACGSGLGAAVLVAIVVGHCHLPSPLSPSLVIGHRHLPLPSSPSLVGCWHPQSTPRAVAHRAGGGC